MVARGYKDTEIGVIPVEWEVVKLDSLGKIITGSTPKTSNQDFYLNGTRLWASPSDLGKSKEVKTTNTKLSDLGFEQIRVLEKRSILITCIGSTIGKMGIAYEEMSSNQQINAITCNEANNPDFYYYVLFKIKDKIQKLAGTQAVPLLNKTDFSQIKVIQPPLKEQEKIADILSTADEKIDAIATQIEKAQTLKKGLLQKLLSEGIEHSEFKDSELGKIPESWEVVELGDIGSFKNGINKNKEDFGFGNKFFNLLDVFGLTSIKKEPVGLVNITDKEKKDFDTRKGDTFFIRSSVKPSGVGLTAVLSYIPIDTVYSGFIIRFRDNNKFELNFKKYCFYDSDFRKRLLSKSSISANTNINQEALKSLLIKLPPLKEQKQIAEILSTADEKLEVLRAKKKKYETLKIGLLQKLLSGEVRV